MWPINITIRNTHGRRLHRTLTECLGAPLCPHTLSRMCQHHDCVCVRGIVIKCELTDDSLLLVSVCPTVSVCVMCVHYCLNGHLPLLITINLTTSIKNPIALPHGCVYVSVCLCVYTHICVHGCDWCLLSFTSLQHPFRFSAPKLPLALAPLSTVSIKQPIHFMTPALLW